LPGTNSGARKSTAGLDGMMALSGTGEKVTISGSWDWQNGTV
jgi:hypothetical protein